MRFSAPHLPHPTSLCSVVWVPFLSRYAVEDIFSLCLTASPLLVFFKAAIRARDQMGYWGRQALCIRF